MVSTQEITGFSVMQFADTSEDEKPNDLDEIATKLLEAYHAYRRGTFKAAAAHSVDAINLLAAEYSINCGASL